MKNLYKLEKLSQIFGKTGGILREYPMVLLMSFLGAVSLMCFAHGNFNSHPNFFVFFKFANPLREDFQGKHQRYSQAGNQRKLKKNKKIGM